MNEEYRVRLDAFEGPLDLLLFLIRKSEVDIHDIPIARVTDQYLGMVAQLQGSDPGRLDIDAAGEFLVMAATLMEIKSRMLLPRAVRQADDTAVRPAEDPRADLVRQLLEYKRFRDAADALERRGNEWQQRFPAGAAAFDANAVQSSEHGGGDAEIEDLDLLDLIEAFKKVQETVNFDRLGDHQITYDDTPIELHAQDILLRLTEHLSASRADVEAGQPLIAAGAELEFKDFFSNRTRSERVGLFLALLELVRNRKVRVRQDKIEGTIHLSVREDSESHPENPPSEPAGNPATS